MATIKGAFPKKIEKVRMTTLQKFSQLYENEQQQVFDLHEIIKKKYANVADILYIAHAIPAKISDFYGDFVQGDVSRLIIDTTGDTQEEKDVLTDIIEDNDLKEAIYDYAVNQSQFGFEVLLGYVKEKKFYIQSVGKDQYFPQKDGSVIFATYVRDPEQQDLAEKNRALLLYTQHYRVEGESVIIERKAWTTDTEGKAADEIDLARVGVEAEKEEKIEGLDELPIVQIDNGRKTKWGFGKSDYNDIMPNLQELNERTTHISTQFIANLDALLELAKLEGTKDEDGNWKKIDTLELPDKETPRAKYVTLDNPLIEEIFKHLDRQLHFISWVTSVPMFELLDSAQPERVEAMRIKMFNAIRRTDTKRAKLSKGVIKILKIGYKMLDKKLENDIYIDYSDVLPTDDLVESQIEESKVNAGLSSRRSAMKRLENYSDEEADAELEIIRNEDIQSGAVNPNNAPQV